jgi:cyclophilin family peptidyl-prolyl cis-trans isomerase
MKYKLLMIAAAVMVLMQGCVLQVSPSVQIEEKAAAEQPAVAELPQKETAEQVQVKEALLKMVKLETSLGDIVIELDGEKAPVTAANFLRYVEEGFYDGAIFHRVIPNFMIQAGGHTPDMARKPVHEPIINEAANGLKNDRGTIAMARTNDPNSASSQFFINLKNNEPLNYSGPGNPGYAVFGRVVEGMDVVDKIAAVKTMHRGMHADVPVMPVVIKSARIYSKE